MAKEFHTDVDLKGVLLLDGNAGNSGFVLKSQGAGNKPVWASDVSIGASASDILSVSAGEITADDLGVDKLYGWDDSQNKAIGFSLGAGLSTDGTTLNVNIDPVIAGMIF